MVNPKFKDIRKPKEASKFNKWIKYCILETMDNNSDINVTTPKALQACAFAYRNRNVPVEPIDTDKRIRLFLTGVINPHDPQWIPTKKEKEETKRRLIKQMGKEEYEKWKSSILM